MSNKAIVTKIEYAGLEFEGLMLPDGSYAIGVSQVASIFSLNKAVATRDLKALLGAGYQLTKVKSEINSNAVNILTLEQFSMVVMKLAFKGNEIAQRFSLASITEKLDRIFDKAFGKEVEEREREIKFMARMETKLSFRPLTDALKEVGFTEPKEYGWFIKRFQDVLGIESGTRDNLSTKELAKLNVSQLNLALMVKMFEDPEKALREWTTASIRLKVQEN